MAPSYFFPLISKVTNRKVSQNDLIQQGRHGVENPDVNAVSKQE